MVNNLASTKIRQELPEQFDTYLFVDSDIGFTAEQAIYAAESKYDIFTLPYLRHSKIPSYEQGMFVEGKPGRVYANFTPETKGIQKIDFTGAGFLKVSKHVLEAMDYPWFRFGVYTEGDEAEQIGEDQQFCIDAKKAGFSIVCDFDRPVFHRKRQVTHY